MPRRGETSTSARMAGGKAAIFAVGHLLVRRSTAMYMPKVMQLAARNGEKWKKLSRRNPY